MNNNRGESWRWNIGKHPRPTTATIVVAEMSDEQRRARERKIEEGARVVPFGFGRVLGGEPLGWEGDNA